MKKFDEVKYNSLLEKLEAVEVKNSICLKNKDYRLEAEYWVLQESINYKTIKGEEIISLVQYGTSDELNEVKKGYPVLRLNEFERSFIGQPAKYCEHLTIEDYSSLRLLKGDVLICRTNGNPNLVGKSALVPEDTEYAYASYLFKIKPRKELINSETLVAFLNSKYGRKEVNKYSMTSNQTNFSPAKFREIDIPIFSSELQFKIQTLFANSYTALKKSKQLYSQAEQTLLQNLGLPNWQPTKKSTAVKSFSISFGNNGRLDAEYYQPKYEEIENRIKNYIYGSKSFSEIINLKDENFDPDEKIEYRYIELADIGNTGEVLSCTTDIGINLPSRARRVVNENDIVISSIEGSLDKCALVSAKYDNALCSTGFYVVNSEKINSETLLLLFKSYPIQQLMKQRCSGTILTAINKDELQTILIPLISSATQKELTKLIKNSFKLREESTRLIETAKQAVEIAIEKNENKAVKFVETSANF